MSHARGPVWANALACLRGGGPVGDPQASPAGSDRRHLRSWGGDECVPHPAPADRHRSRPARGDLLLRRCLVSRALVDPGLGHGRARHRRHGGGLALQRPGVGRRRQLDRAAVDRRRGRRRTDHRRLAGARTAYRGGRRRPGARPWRRRTACGGPGARGARRAAARHGGPRDDCGVPAGRSSPADRREPRRRPTG